MSIVIHLGRKPDGRVYELSPASREALKSVPGAHPVKRVFIAFDNASDFDRGHAPVEWQVAQLLTGLGEEQMVALGGVELYDPRSQVMTQLPPRRAA